MSLISPSPVYFRKTGEIPSAIFSLAENRVHSLHGEILMTSALSFTVNLPKPVDLTVTVILLFPQKSNYLYPITVPFFISSINLSSPQLLTFGKLIVKILLEP